MPEKQKLVDLVKNKVSAIFLFVSLVVGYLDARIFQPVRTIASVAASFQEKLDELPDGADAATIARELAPALEQLRDSAWQPRRPREAAPDPPLEPFPDPKFP